jgi:hypothetical protein
MHPVDAAPNVTALTHLCARSEGTSALGPCKPRTRAPTPAPTPRPPHQSVITVVGPSGQCAKGRFLCRGCRAGRGHSAASDGLGACQQCPTGRFQVCCVRCGAATRARLQHACLEAV